MPEADVRLYGIDSFATGVYFASEEELIHYINTYEIGIWSNLVVLEYFANFGDHQDVFRKTLNDGSTVFLSAYSTNEVHRLDIKASLESGHFIWETIPGSLQKEYRILKQMNIVPENDPYQVLDTLSKMHKRELSLNK